MLRGCGCEGAFLCQAQSRPAAFKFEKVRAENDRAFRARPNRQAHQSFGRGHVPFVEKRISRAGGGQPVVHAGGKDQPVLPLQVSKQFRVRQRLKVRQGDFHLRREQSFRWQGRLRQRADLMPAREQFQRGVVAQKAGRADNKYLHGGNYSRIRLLKNEKENAVV